MKPGATSTEFWLGVLSVAGALLSDLGKAPEPEVRIALIAAVTVTVVTYTICRTLTKLRPRGVPK